MTSNQDEQEEAPAVGDSESGFDTPDDEEPEQGIAEAPPDRGFIGGNWVRLLKLLPILALERMTSPPSPNRKMGKIRNTAAWVWAINKKNIYHKE